MRMSHNGSASGSGSSCSAGRTGVARITSTISSLQVFDIVYTLTKGGPLETTRTIVYNIYDDGFRFFRMGDATAAAWILFVIILVITIIQFRVQRYWVHYE